MKKIVPSPTSSSPVGLYGYGNAGQAASQAWRAMDEAGLGCERSQVQNPGGTPFLKVSVSDEIS